MINDHLMRLGGGSVQFRPDFPVSKSNEILALIDEDASGAGADIMFTPVHMPVSLGDTVISAAATFSGHVTKSRTRLSLEFDGLGWWLDTHLEADISKTAGTPTQWLTSLLVNDLTVGTVSGGSNVTREFLAHSVTYREALDAVALAGDWEYRINADGSVDAGTSVFQSTPTVVVTRKPGGAGGAYRGVDGSVLDHEIDVTDLSTKVVPFYSDEESGEVKAGTAATQALSLKTRAGNTPVLVEVIDSPLNTAAEATAAATDTLGLRVLKRAVKVSSSTHHLSSLVRAGDDVYVYDLVGGLVDTTNQIAFEGERISPVQVRVIDLSLPINGGGVYIRPCAASPTLIDVTDWVAWESGDASWTVGTWEPYAGGTANRHAVSELELNLKRAAIATMTTYTAAPEFGGSTTNVTEDFARYLWTGGGYIEGEVKATLTGTPTTGNFRFALPAVPNTMAGGRAVIGDATLLDFGSNWRSATALGFSDGYGYVDLAEGTGVHDLCRSVAPWTWTTNDELLIRFRYRPA